MKKEVNEKENTNRKKVIAVTASTLIVVSSIVYSAETLFLSKDKDSLNLMTLLNSYGYEFNGNYYEAGYLLGFNNSYYKTNYELYESQKIMGDVEAYNSLKNVYFGEYKDEYLVGLQHGIETGTEKAIIDYEKDNMDYSNDIVRKRNFTRIS